MGQAVWSGLAVGAAYALMSLGFALELEVCDIVNAAHGAFVVLGMYIMLELVGAGVPVVAAVAVAAAAVGVLSVPIYFLFVGPARASAGHRVQLIYTLLILIVSPAAFQLLFGGNILTVNHAFSRIGLPGGALNTAQVATIVIAVVLSIGVALAARGSTWGKLAYVAGRYPTGARAIGVSIPRVYAMVFVIGGVLAGLAGGLIVPFQPVSPTLAIEFVSIVFLVALVGRTSPVGCLFLGLLYGLAQALFDYLLPADISAWLTFAVFLGALMVVQRQTIRTRLAV